MKSLFITFFRQIGLFPNMQRILYIIGIASYMPDLIITIWHIKSFIANIFKIFSFTLFLYYIEQVFIYYNFMQLV